MSLRTRLILVTIFALLPLAGLGLVLTVRATGAGETLLTAQLQDQLNRSAASLELRWREVRSDLLLLGENEPARRALATRPPERADTVPGFVRRAFESLTTVEAIVFYDATGAVRWRLGGSVSAGAQGQPVPAISVRLELADHVNGTALGSLEAHVRAAAMLPAIALTDARGSSLLLAAVMPDGHLVAPPFSDPAVFRSARTTSGDRHWLSLRRRIPEPALELVVAGTLDPYAASFRRAARNGAITVVLVAGLLVGLAAAATRRITRDLERLVVAAEAVTAGDLERRVDTGRADEIGRMAAAFNTMTDSLRRSMRQLAQREALAAVGEFAADLSHEIRNPLTSMRLDLQRLDEVEGDRDAVRAIAERALRQVARLDRAVNGALRVSRGVHAERRPVVLQEVLEGARRSTESEFSHRGAQLTVASPDARPAVVQADAAALEQMFVNLLVNAAQALSQGGVARLSLEQADARVAVTVQDFGSGMSETELERVQRPFYSTKRDGTGLGLAIARRIAEAHGGTLTLRSSPGTGTIVEVQLPLAAALPA